MKRAVVVICLFALSFFTCSGASGEVSLNVVGDLIQSFAINPGGRVTGEITVENNGDEEGDVKIYFVDFLHYADGRNLFQKPGTVERSNASWFSVFPSQGVVPAGGSMRVSFYLSVPADPSLKGTFWSVLMVEPVPKVLLTPQEKTEDVNLQVVTVTRFAVQMITNIGKTGEAGVSFVERAVVKEGGKRYLKLDIGNNGERVLTPHVWAELFTSKGKSSGKIDGSRHRIYPGCSSRFLMDLSGLAAGSYKAVVVADNGDNNVFGANYTLDLK